MKKIILILVVALMGCHTYVQVYDVVSPDTYIKENKPVFENDTVKITYWFWSDNGVMAFSIYNKLDKPIFIDWKISSCIINDNKLNYWQDELETTSSSFYSSYYFKQQNPMLTNQNEIVNNGASIGNSKTIKPERLTSIPPKSNYYRYQFYLTKNYVSLGTNYIDSSKLDKYKYANKLITEKYKFKYRNFDYSESPLKFRNYIAICFAENSHEYTYIDNSFYVSGVKEMITEDFYGYEYHNAVYDFPFHNNSSFYIYLGGNKTTTK
jgi:hypothetical protein